MVFIPNGFGHATLVFSTGGPSGPVMTTFGFISVGGLDPDGEAEDVRVAWATAGGLWTVMQDETDLVETRVLIRRNDGELVSGLDTTTVPSTSSASGASSQVATLIQKRTGLAGRNRRGRMFLPGSQAVGQDSAYTAGQMTALTNASNVFLAALTTNNVPMYLLHVSEADTPNEVTALVPQAITATQRRRVR